jgi:WD40 repeat protein
MSVLSLLVAITGSLAAAQPAAVPANEATWVVPKDLPAGAKLRLGSGGIVLQHTRYGHSLAQMSPDGRLLAIALDPQLCVVRERATGKELYTLKAARTILDGNSLGVLQFAPNGKTLVFGTTSRLQFVDAVTGANLKTIPLPGRIDYWLSLSADGKRLAASLWGNGKRPRSEIVDFETAKSLPAIATALKDRRDVAHPILSADGKTVALFGFASKPELSRLVELWDIDSAKEIGRIDLGESMLHDTPDPQASEAAFSPDGATLAIWISGRGPEDVPKDADAPPNRPGQILLYNAKTRRERRLLTPVGEGYPSQLKFSPDGQQLVAATQYAVSAWRTDSGKPIPLARRRGGDVQGIAFAGAEILVLSANGDIFNWWDAVSGRPGFVSNGPRYGITNLAFTDTKTLLSVTRDGAAIEWDSTTGKILKRRYIGKKPGSENGFWREGTTIVSAEGLRAAVGKGWSDELEGFDGLSNRSLFKIGLERDPRVHSSTVRMSFAPHEDKVIVALGSSFVLYDANTGERDAKVAWDEKSGQSAVAIEISRDLKQVAVALESEPGPSFFGKTPPRPLRPFVFDATTGKLLHAFPKSAWAGHIAFSPNAKLLAVSDKGEIRLHNAATGVLERTLKFTEPEWIATALRWAPDGKTIAVGTMPPKFEDVYRESSLERFNVADGKSLQQTPTRHNGISRLAFAPDGRTLATAGHDETILIWPLE